MDKGSRTRMDAYIRVSRVMGREGESYISPDVQRQAIHRWAEYHDVEIAHEHLDEDQSGGTHNRPGLNAAISRALAGETGGIIAWKLDRFSRNTEAALTDLRRLQRVGARLAFVVEDIDTGTVHGRMIYTILLAVSEAFLESIKAGWRITKERAISRGALIGPTPIGYRRGVGGTIEPDPSSMAAVVAAFTSAADGNMRDAVEAMREVSPSMTAWHVRRMLRNRVYLGEQAYGELTNRQAHEPLVARDMWERAQPDPERPARSSKRPYPLSQLASCSACGAPLTGATAGAGVRVYRCSSRECDERVMVTADAAERYLIEQIAAAVDARGSFRLDAVEDEGNLDVLHAELIAAEHERDTFAADPFAREALGPAGWQAALVSRVERVATAREAYRNAAEMSRSVDLRMASDELRALPPEGMREVFAAVFAQVIVGPSRKGRVPLVDRVRVVTHGDPDAMSPAEDAG